MSGNSGLRWDRFRSLVPYWNVDLIELRGGISFESPADRSAAVHVTSWVGDAQQSEEHRNQNLNRVYWFTKLPKNMSTGLIRRMSFLYFGGQIMDLCVKQDFRLVKFVAHR